MDENKGEHAVTPREGRDRGQEGPPQKFGETNPQGFPGQNYDFTLQAVYEMKGTLGELKNGIATLTEQVKENDKKLDHIALVVYAAGIVVAILGTIGGFIIRGAWDIIAPILKEHIH
jgi:hypothetical protein